MTPSIFIAKCFLVFSQDTVLIPLIVLGYLWLDRRLFSQATCLLFLSMLLNYAEKISFQIPLAEHLGPGFAFPSGHMQSACAFYGWLAFRLPSIRLRLGIVVLLLGIGYGLIRLGYHQIQDLIAAVLSAALLIVGYLKFLYQDSARTLFLKIGLATILLGYIYLQGPSVPKASWLAYYALLGFSIALYLQPKSQTKIPIRSHLSQKALATFLFFISFLIIHQVFQKLSTIHPELPPYLSESQWLLIGFILPNLATRP